MQLYLISYLVSICFWLWIIMKYDKFEREPLKSVLFAFIIGGLISSLPAGLFNSLFSGLIDYRFAPGTAVDRSIGKSMLFFAFVGFNEEFFKAAATVLLIRKMKDFNEPADALVYAMSVAFGFSVFENIEYTLNLGLTAFYIRQFNAVPLHIGLASIWGTGIAKARFLHQGKYWITMLPYIMIAAFLHFIYNFSPRIILNPILSLLLSTLIAFLLIRVAVRKLKRYSEDGPFSNRLFCRHCNTPNLVYARVCNRCGEKFQFEFYRHCSNCGTKVDRQATTCSNCGAELLPEI
jgi:RsiW-degrading membrane proteinase PrsW (M82 family)